MVLHEFGEESHDVGAATLGHGSLGLEVSGYETPNTSRH
jgi:hypothetical protein